MPGDYGKKIKVIKKGELSYIEPKREGEGGIGGTAKEPAKELTEKELVQKTKSLVDESLREVRKRDEEDPEVNRLREQWMSGKRM